MKAKMLPIFFMLIIGRAQAFNNWYYFMKFLL
jgi:hypothetical protein